MTIGDHSFSDGLEKVRIGPVEELRGAPKIYSMDEKKKRKKEKEEKNEERERERENVTVITRSHHCDRVRSLQIFRNNATLPTPTTAPGDREFPL